jgi:hypothetical protein
MGAKRSGENVLQYARGKLGPVELEVFQKVASVVHCKETLVNTTEKHKRGVPLADKGRTWMHVNDIRVAYHGVSAFFDERLDVLLGNLVSMSYSRTRGTTWLMLSCKTNSCVVQDNLAFLEDNFPVLQDNFAVLQENFAVLDDNFIVLQPRQVCNTCS